MSEKLSRSNNKSGENSKWDTLGAFTEKAKAKDSNILETATNKAKAKGSDFLEKAADKASSLADRVNSESEPIVSNSVKAESPKDGLSNQSETEPKKAGDAPVGVEEAQVFEATSDQVEIPQTPQEQQPPVSPESPSGSDESNSLERPLEQEKEKKSIDDFSPKIIQKAKDLDKRFVDIDDQIAKKEAEINDLPESSSYHDKRRVSAEAALQALKKERNDINSSELSGIEDKLDSAKKQLLDNYRHKVNKDTEFTPDGLIDEFSEKRTKLTEDIKETGKSFNELQGSDIGAIWDDKDKLPGLMTDIYNHKRAKEQLEVLDKEWNGIGGDKVDVAQEKIDVKDVYELIKQGDTEKESSQEQEDEPKREAYLKYMAESQKLHWSKGRIKTNGKLAVALRGLGADNLVDQLTQPTEEEEKLKADYNKYLETKQKEALKDYEEGSEEFYAVRAKFLTEQYAKDTQKIAELQKDNAKKPMNKWLRRAGYAGAGVAGGLIALTPLGLVGGAAAAAGGAIALRRNANKRNALTESKDGEGLVVDQLAKERATKFGNNASEHKKDYDANTITDWHEDDKKTEIDKNRRQMLVPVLGAVAVSLATKYGIDFAQENINSTGNTDPNTEPTDTATTETPKGRVEAEPSDIGSEAPVIPESASNIPEYTGGYPWDWASDLVGSEQATSELHRLTEIASQNGYDVVWNGLGDGVDTNDWISINGNSDSEYVVNILRQYL